MIRNMLRKLRTLSVEFKMRQIANNKHYTTFGKLDCLYSIKESAEFWIDKIEKENKTTYKQLTKELFDRELSGIQ